LSEVNGALPILRAAIRTSEEAGWSALAVELYDRMGSAYYLLRQPHGAGRLWDKALSTYEEAQVADPLLKARILGHLANLYYVAGQPREAIAGYQAAIESAGPVLDMQALCGIYEGLAVAFQRTGQVERALEYAQRSLRLFETLGDVRMSAQLRNNMAKILLDEGRAEEAGRVFLEGADQLRRINEKDLLPLLLAGAAEAALDEGQLATAEARLAEAMAAVPESRDPLARLTTARIGGRIAQTGGQPAQARSHFEAALEIAAALDSRMERSRVLYDYAQVLEVQGDAVGAIARYREAYEAQRVANSA
jgi:tetratricopeptide (TPR) repeat protein